MDVKVEAARRVLIEVAHVLSQFSDRIALVGGWVPTFLFPDGAKKHIGSTDVDLALDHTKIGSSGYQTIRQALEDKGYSQRDTKSFVFYRELIVNGVKHTVELDLLAGQYGGTDDFERSQSVEDVRPFKARGCDLVFANTKEVTIEGMLPDGALDRVTIRVAAIVPFLVMKAMALANRLKEKDAYDIYYCLRYYPGGLEALSKEFAPYKDNALVQEALTKIGEKFATAQHLGPAYAASVDLMDEDERDRVKRDAYERVSTLLAMIADLPL